MSERPMIPIVYNGCYGGFSLSEAGMLLYAAIKGLTLYIEKERLSRLNTYWTVPEADRDQILDNEEWFAATLERKAASNEAYNRLTISCRDFDRTDPILVQVVRELGPAANGMCADLQIAEVPCGERYRIDEYDGNERVMTVESYDWTVAGVHESSGRKLADANSNLPHKERG